MEKITKKKNGKPKKDLRSVRSCKEIANALATLLQEKLFEDISVTDIVNKANVQEILFTIISKLKKISCYFFSKIMLKSFILYLTK